MKKLFVTGLVISFFLTGCNTFKGFGQDVSNVGHAVSNTASKTQQKM